MGETVTRNYEIPKEANDTGIADAPTFNAAMDWIDGLLADGTIFGDKHWRGPVADVASLPPSGNVVGDVRVTLDTFQLWVWNGSSWDLGSSGALVYRGVWDATNPPAGGSPTLADGVGLKGDYYVVGAAGVQDLGSGPIDFNPADWAVYDGTIWQKADHTDAVSSVFGRLGAVIAALGDYAASLVTNDSGVAGATVKEALDTLAISSLNFDTYSFGRPAPTTNAYLDTAGGVVSNLTGYPMHKNSIIRFVSVSVNATSTCTVEIYRSGSGTPIETLALNGTFATKVSTATISAGEQLSARILGGPAQRPVVTVIVE